MNKFFRRLPLHIKLLLIGLLPLVYIIYLSIQVYDFETQKVNLFKNYHQRISQSENINNLISELQNERKYSYEFAAKKDFHKKLIDQRIRTDSAIKLLEQSPDLMLYDFPSYTFLNNLTPTRNNLDTTSHANADAIMYYYTNIIYRLNTLNAMPGGSVSYLQSVYKDFVSQHLLSEMITFLGIMRANIYTALFRKDYKDEAQKQMIMIGTLMGTRGVYDNYNSFEKEFFLKSSDQSIKAYNDLLANSHYKLTKKYIDTVFKRMNFDSTYDAAMWESISDKGADELKKIQKESWKSADSKITDIYNNEKSKQVRTLVLLMLAILFVTGIVSYTIFIITKMLRELKQSAEKISLGATDVNIKISSDDTIGSLAQSISNINENNKILANAADAIGKGNFNVVLKPRSSEDLLGNSLVKMKDDLDLFIRKNAELMRKKDEFMSIASHELKTPITSVKAAVQIVERFSSEQKEMAPIHSFITKASKQIDKLTNIVNDLLDVTKIQSGKLELSKSEFVIQELIKESYELMQYNLQGHEIIFKGNADIKIIADKDRLEQVMTNLISNAIKYSPQSDKVIIEVIPGDSFVKISVTDFGIGIAKEKLPFIFDRYFRVEESSQEFSGLGLGLYISCEIVKRHQGEIGVDSEPGKGSTFWFTVATS